ncbi:putative F-box domain, FBD domain, leucine-rich repeat domain, L domain-containing protein [Rosa chinensis]|uniref:Putative F-box domain, FBD domain, leucine-rich repeat domain, L domain-containing protein n=1 Tax=Rosa chinensis TaxID=74649 RepID=A0A2P6PYI5_ROSCH|nr:F-box/FBD/LRR-repeat protein At1g13570 [Rosa chinensis]PRQ26969.1 putative F-box domain, FBD domain, leucine-rich repeat domain, L domain-containing protein [Rosa chinensis]
MKQRDPPKSHYKLDVELDRLSNLPCHIIDQILQHMPIKEAVRTSVLSTKWRYKSSALGHLVFDHQCVSGRNQTTFVNIVDHVLLLHTGPIHMFKLSNRDFLATSDIDRWILYLSRCSVKEFILEIWKGPRFTIPSCLFSLQEMTHLELFNCLLKPSLTFKGFRSLKSLDIQHVTLAQDVFEKLIVCCPLLERLTLMNFDGFTDLNIDAPNLQFFDVGGSFEDVNFVNTLNLTVVSIALYEHGPNQQRRSPRNSGNLVKVFAQLPHVQRLEIQSHFLKYLAAGVVSGKLPKPCLDLNFLSIRVYFSDWEEVLTAVFLLRSSPSLQELEILVRPDEQPAAGKTNFSVNDNCNGPFAQLRLVKISGISDIEIQVDFIRFLLSNSPMLEKMIVKPASVNWELVKKLLRFKRASANAEMIYLDP